MDATHLINIAGTDCPPEWDREFTEWYYDKHIPLTMKFKGLKGVSRYRLASFGKAAALKKYPLYATLYRFDDFDAFKAWNVSPELAEASADATTLFAKWGVKSIWRVQYQARQTWGKTPPVSVIDIEGIDCSPPGEPRVVKWLEDKYFPLALGSASVSGIAYYRLAGSIGLGVRLAGGVPVGQTKSYPGYLSLRYFKDQSAAAAFEASQEGVDAEKELSRTASETGLSLAWKARYVPIKNWEQ